MAVGRFRRSQKVPARISSKYGFSKADTGLRYLQSLDPTRGPPNSFRSIFEARAGDWDW